MKEINILWFKKDLRIFDNEALCEAIKDNDILPIFIIELDIWNQNTHSHRQWQFCKESLIDLRNALAMIGQPLIIRTGNVIDIFDEINEELKQDRMTALWQRYGKYVIAFVIAVVAGVSLTQGYSYYTQKRDDRSADLFFNAILSDDVSVTLEAAKEELSGGYVLLAEFRLAAALAKNDQATEAEQHYLSIAARDDIQQIYRDIALLLSIMQAPESTQLSDLQTRLDPLIASVSPLKGLALEQAAALDVRRGNKAAAIKKLNELVALTDIPANLRQRASQILTVLNNS